MMATEVNQTYFAWSQGKTTEVDGSQGVSVSQTLDHGSISFGRFELESLSWEKWSVFTNDRRHEEFGKFNGLVAQKKAYFEEYYKRIRELKASQQQSQQTELILEYCGDGSDSSQTGEEEQAAHETTCEQGDDHEQFSSSNLLSSAGILQQTNQNTRENDSGDNSDSVDVMVQKNASSGHDGIAAVYENARAPKRVIDKDSRLRYASKIIPKLVKNLSDPVHQRSVSKRSGLVEASLTTNQKTKTDNARSLQRPNKMGTSQIHSPTSKEALRVMGVRRPSSATGGRPSTRERHPITMTAVKKPSDVSTPRRPSIAERRPVTRERAPKQGGITTLYRPSSIYETHPVNRENAAKHTYVATARRPSTGDRRPVNRDSVLMTDPRMHSKTRATVAHPKGATTTMGVPKKSSPPSATKSSNLEPESNTKGGKGPSRPKTMDLHVAAKQKSRSVNLPPRKLVSPNIGESALETVTRPNRKEGISVSMQFRTSTSKKTTPSQNGSSKGRAPNPPPPPPQPRRPSRTTDRTSASNSSTGGRKPKASAPQWH